MSGPILSNSGIMNTNKSPNITVQENRQKAAKMLIYVVIIFVICYIPVHAFNLFRYIFVYVEYLKRPHVDLRNHTNETIECYHPRIVSLDRTGTIKIITITALISHILPYFNSSVNPIIYNIMSDKFRLKFRELFSSCCCCFDSIFKVKSTSSTMIQLKSLSAIQPNQHHSSTSTPNKNQYCPKTSYQLITTKSSNSSNGSLKTSSVSSNKIIARQCIINAYSHKGPIAIRLTNV